MRLSWREYQIIIHPSYMRYIKFIVDVRGRRLKHLAENTSIY